jgi:hypothetical protein
VAQDPAEGLVTTDSPVVEARSHGRLMLVQRPAVSPGAGSVDVLCTLARARARSAAACFLPPAGEPGALVSAITAGDVSVVRPGPVQLAWFTTRLRLAAARRTRRSWWRERMASGLQEGYRELRRHAGNERLPVALRRRLRESAHVWHDRAASLRTQVTPYPRRLLREPSTVAWPAAEVDAAAAEARTAGIALDRPLVVIHGALGAGVSAAVIAFLAGEGYTVARLGARDDGPRGHRGVVDLPAHPGRSLRLDLFLLRSAAFAIGTSLDLQQLTYLTNTPSLVVHAADPFSRYPIRPNGLYLLGTVVDLDSGRVLPLDEQIGDAVLRQPRRWGRRGSTASDVIDAIRELQAGVREGFRPGDAQAVLRARLVEAGRTLAPAVPFVAEWGPDDGFLGDGWLARVQAERVA